VSGAPTSTEVMASAHSFIAIWTRLMALEGQWCLWVLVPRNARGRLKTQRGGHECDRYAECFHTTRYQPNFAAHLIINLVLCVGNARKQAAYRQLGARMLACG
jgi:hypothetical protein